MTGATSGASLVGVATFLLVVGAVTGVLATGEGSAVEGPVVEGAAIQADEPPVEAWNETFGRSGDDVITGAVPADDGYLLVGRTETAIGGVDGWLMVVDDSGDRQFDATFGGPGEDRISDAVRTDDGFLLAGWRATDESVQGWLLKVDDRGVEQWSRTLGGPRWDGFWKLTRTADGDYVAVGRTGFEAWAVTVDAEGETQWNRTYGGPGDRATFGAVVATGDGLLLAGWTDSPNGSETGLAVRVNESGDEQWARSYEEDDGTRIWSAETTDDGFLLAGETNPADEPPRGWARLVGGDGDVEARWSDPAPGSRFIDSVPVEDGVLLVGGANRSGAGYDALATRFDGDLERRWEATAGGIQWDLAVSGIATDDGYLLCGTTTSAGAGGQDGWLAHLESGEAPGS